MNYFLERKVFPKIDSAEKNLIKFFTKLHIFTIVYINYFITMTPEAERFNGWAAMLGFVAAVGAT